MIFKPVFIQITDHGKFSVIITIELVKMAFVKASFGINSHVDFIVFQAEKKTLIKMLNKLLKTIQKSVTAGTEKYEVSALKGYIETAEPLIGTWTYNGIPCALQGLEQ